MCSATLADTVAVMALNRDPESAAQAGLRDLARFFQSEPWPPNRLVDQATVAAWAQSSDFVSLCGQSSALATAAATDPAVWVARFAERERKRSRRMLRAIISACADDPTVFVGGATLPADPDMYYLEPCPPTLPTLFATSRTLDGPLGSVVLVAADPSATLMCDHTLVHRIASGTAPYSPWLFFVHAHDNLRPSPERNFARLAPQARPDFALLRTTAQHPKGGETPLEHASLARSFRLEAWSTTGELQSLCEQRPAYAYLAVYEYGSAMAARHTVPGPRYDITGQDIHCRPRKLRPLSVPEATVAAWDTQRIRRRLDATPKNTPLQTIGLSGPYAWVLQCHSVLTAAPHLADQVVAAWRRASTAYTSHASQAKAIRDTYAKAHRLLTIATRGKDDRLASLLTAHQAIITQAESKPTTNTDFVSPRAAIAYLDAVAATLVSLPTLESATRDVASALAVHGQELLTAFVAAHQQ